MITRAKRAKILQEQLESKFKPLRGLDCTPPPGGWCAAIRESLGMSAIDLAKMMGIDVSTLYRLEESEAKGKISLETLNRIASSLGAEVKYVVVPKLPLPQMLLVNALAYASEAVGSISQSMALEDQKASKKFNKKQREDLVKQLVEAIDPKVWKRK